MQPSVLSSISQHIRSHQSAVDAWLRSYQQKLRPPFYCSVDLRDSGYKIVPVDNNLYPAGFNNICPQDLTAAVTILRTHLHSISQSLQRDVKKILILPESHTHNKFYLENLYFLREMVQDAGYETRIGWYGLLPEGKGKTFTFHTASEKELVYDAISIVNGSLTAGQFEPDLILLNNDFSSGYARDFDHIKQPILPTHLLGWHSRKKSRHFQFYNQLAFEFASIIDVDPWLFQVETLEVTPVDFLHNVGVQDVCAAVDHVLMKTQRAYEARHIAQRPFAFVKHNAGTYGMGIMVATSSEDIRQMNRRTKNKMSVGKNNLTINSVCVQEGVPTIISSDHIVAEPVIYMIGWELIGVFLRTNAKRTNEENLSADGVVFKRLCLSDYRAKEPSRYLVYSAIAHLSAIAAALEQEHGDQYFGQDIAQ